MTMTAQNIDKPCHAKPLKTELMHVKKIGTVRQTSMKFRQPSRGTNAVIFLPFLMSWTRTHLRIAEFGCLASTPLQHSN